MDSLAGKTPLRDYGSFIDSLKEGRSISIADVRLDDRTKSAADAMEGRRARSFINVPVLESGILVAVLFVNSDRVRQWTDGKLDFVKEERFDALLREAGECDLIARLATDKDKSARFRKLAEQYRAMADDMREAIAKASSKLSD